MSHPAIAPEMRRRFEAAEKIRIAQTPLRRPALSPDASSLRRHFESEVGRAAARLENPHVEPRVPASAIETAVPASVLIAVVLRDDQPTVLVTRRPHGISFPGHWVFPGGRADDGDLDPIDTALREAEEEIGLPREHVETLGRLGSYVSHSGFLITPVVALVRPPFPLKPQPGEVDRIAEIALSRVLDSSSYFLYRFAERPDRAHFALDASDASDTSPTFGASERASVVLTGITVSLCIGLYSELSKTHV